MPAEGLAALEAETEELREELLFLGQSDDAVADVARRQHPEFLAQDAGAAAFVGDGDDRAEPFDRPHSVGVDVSLQAAEQRREAGAAADGDDVQAMVAHASRKP